MRPKIFYKSLQCKVLTAVVIGLLFSVVGLFYIEVTTSEREIKEDINRSLEHVSSVIYLILEETMAKGRKEEVPSRLKHILAVPDIVYIRLVDKNFTPKFEASDNHLTGKRIKKVRQPITPKQVCKQCHGDVDLIGYLEIGFDVTQEQNRLAGELMRHLGLYAFMFVIILFYLVVTLRKGIFQRLEKLSRAMEFFGKGDFHRKVDVTGEDELSRISMVFNTMAENISVMNQRLFRVSEFSIEMSKKETEWEVVESTVSILQEIFNPNSIEIRLQKKVLSDRDREDINNPENHTVVEPIIVDKKEAGHIRVVLTLLPTDIDMRLIKLIASVTSAAIERIRHQQQICTLNEELMHLDRLSTAGTMVGAMAHEINNPLSVIGGTAEVMLDIVNADPVRPEEVRKFKEYIDVIKEASRRIQSYVDDMLRFIGKRQSKEMEVFDLHEVIKAVLNIKEFDLKNKNIKVQLSLCDEPVKIKGILHQIEQVLLNLINNAEYEMYKQQGRGTLNIVTEVIDGYVELRIEDSGPGIPEHVIPRIFDSFFTTKPPVEGTGLGLAIVKNIIEDHNGSVFVQNKKDGGAVFTVRLPRIVET